MSRFAQPPMAKRRASKAALGDMSNGRNVARTECLASPHYQKINHSRAILAHKGIPQEFTFATTFGGERSCELFRGIDFFTSGSCPGANHTIHLGRVLWRYSA